MFVLSATHALAARSRISLMPLVVFVSIPSPFPGPVVFAGREVRPSRHCAASEKRSHCDGTKID